MGNGRKQEPPRTRALASIEQSRPGLLELDRFSEAHLAHWKRLSGDLDELNELLYYVCERVLIRFDAFLLASFRQIFECHRQRM